MPFSIGGGTMLMRRYRHRKSRDLDVFVDSVQFVRMLSPRANAFTADRFPDYEESANALKLIVGMQEIDIIAAPRLTDNPTRRRILLGREVEVEEPREILAKKLYYRGRLFTPRDVFDLATVAKFDPGQLQGLGFLLREKGLAALAARCRELADTFVREAAAKIDVLPRGRPVLGEGMAMLRSCLDAWYREIGLPPPSDLAGPADPVGPTRP